MVYDTLWGLGPQTSPNEGFTEKAIFPVVQDMEEKKNLVIDEKEQQKELVSVADMDQLICDTFYMAISTKIRSKDLPMLSNTFYANIMLPCRPAHSTLQLKQSSFRKLSSFLKEMEKIGCCEVISKDGVDLITYIRKNHALVQYETREEFEALATDAAGGSAPEYFEPNIVELYKPTATMAFIFKENPKAYLTALEINTTLKAYLQAQGLLTEPIVLNSELTDAIFRGTKKIATGYPTHLPFGEATKLLVERCQKFHSIQTHPDQKATVKKGLVRNIEIKRIGVGNKKLTSISFLEQFGIVPSHFAKEARIFCACSVTTQASVDTAQATEQVIIQGQFVTKISTMLERMKIPTKYNTASYQKGVSKKKKKN